MLSIQVYTPDKLHQLMADADYVVAALPSTPATQKLISADAIAAMKPTGVFVNVGRGSTVDEEALIQGQLPVSCTRPTKIAADSAVLLQGHHAVWKEKLLPNLCFLQPLNWHSCDTDV